MPVHTVVERTLTDVDHVRLENLVRRSAPDGSPRLPLQLIEEMLDTCDVVPSRQVSPDVVTMGSRVLLHEPGSGDRTELTLCYPGDADPARGSVSVLSPVGRSLLGLRVGQVAHWTTPSGDERAAEVAGILFQPEANGDYLT